MSTPSTRDRPITDSLRIATAQLNPVMGDIAGNLKLIEAARAQGAGEGADIVVTPELSVIGYPPEDLMLKPAAVDDCMAAVQSLAAQTGDGGPALIVGAPWRSAAGVHNGALLLDDGKVQVCAAKHELPNYSVFDEKRIFAPGPLPDVVEWRGMRLGLPVCEDIWLDRVPMALAAQGAQMFICINGSPWRRGIAGERARAFQSWSAQARAPLVFVNQAGGQDELVFDGASFSWDAAGDTVQRLAAFAPDLDVASWSRTGPGQAWRCTQARTEPAAEGLDADYRAAVLAVRDYVNKNGFPGVVLGLSGGIDSALTAVIAVDALGPGRVRCVRLPSRYSSQGSLDDAAACADALGVELDTISIEPAVEGFAQALAEVLDPRRPGAPTNKALGLTEENIQSRARGVVLMALSNALGDMVLTTGNKSELAVGYATLYGDMNGGYNALKDLYKTEVYDLARWRNAHLPVGALGPAGEVTPQATITKAPSAELRPDQTDQDSLPPYDVLDDILRGLVDNEEDVEAIIARGHDPKTVQRIQHLVFVAEYKRRQAAPGAKIGAKNFGRDRRYPITNHYRDQID